VEAEHPVAAEGLPPDRKQIAQAQTGAAQLEDAGWLVRPQARPARSPEDVGALPPAFRDADACGDHHDAPEGEQLDVGAPDQHPIRAAIRDPCRRLRLVADGRHERPRAGAARGGENGRDERRRSDVKERGVLVASYGDVPFRRRCSRGWRVPVASAPAPASGSSPARRREATSSRLAAIAVSSTGPP